MLAVRWHRVRRGRARREVERVELHWADAHQGAAWHPCLRCVRVLHLANLAGARPAAEGGQEVWRQLPQLLAPARRRHLHQREQGREAGDPDVPSGAQDRGVVRRVGGLGAEARASVGSTQPARHRRDSAVRRHASPPASRRIRVADRGRHDRAPHRGRHQRRGLHGDLWVEGVADVPRPHRGLRGHSLRAARRRVVRVGDLAGPTRRGGGAGTHRRREGGQGESCGQAGAEGAKGCGKWKDQRRWPGPSTGSGTSW